MKKTIALVLIIALALSLTACSSFKLSEDEELYIIASDGSLTYKAMIEGEDFASDMAFSFSDKPRDITKSIEETFKEWGVDAEVKSFKKVKDYALIEIKFANPMLNISIGMTAEDFADKHYNNMSAMAERLNFLTYKDGKELKVDDIRKYTKHLVHELNGGDYGTYYQVPGRIELISSNMGYNNIKSNIIFVDKHQYGYIIYRSR